MDEPIAVRPVTRPAHVAAHVGTVVTMFAWGTLVPTAKIVLTEFDAWTLSTLRVAAAAGVLLAISIGIDGVSWLRTIPWPRAMALGAAVAAFSLLFTVGIALSNPVSAIIVSGASPVVAAAYAALAFRQPLPRGAIGAFGLSTAGAIIAALGNVAPGAQAGVRGGEWLLVLASLSWTWYSLKAQLWLGSWGQHRVTAVSYLGAAAVLTPIYLVLLAAGVAAVPRSLPSPSTLALLVWLIGAVTLLGSVLWNYGVSRIGIIVTSLYLNLIPLFGIVTAAAFGSYPTGQQLLGCALVIAGVALLRRPKPAS
ncbi:MAG TPA: DMT family transporter [Stellaceae bacterium]|nr:DMT family transporter [Stellaceae bacterium]